MIVCGANREWMVSNSAQKVCCNLEYVNNTTYLKTNTQSQEPHTYDKHTLDLRVFRFCHEKS
jgi:hypothetical protein